MTHQAGEPETGGEKMLLKITDGQALDERKLMDVYAESNLENTDFFCPEEPDKEAAVRMVESGFLDFLKNEFFKEPEAICWVLEEDGVWVSALRICRIPEGPYYLEALETRPDRRRQGYGVRLLSEVLDAMKAEGPALRLRGQKEHRVPEGPRKMRLPYRVGKGLRLSAPGGG